MLDYATKKTLFSAESKPLDIAVLIQWVKHFPKHGNCRIKARNRSKKMKPHYVISGCWHRDPTQLSTSCNPCIKATSRDEAVLIPQLLTCFRINK